jgi:carbamoylphosphate synthase large subunit
MSRILVIGPGPAVIGEGGELDAAAAEAVRALRDRGHEVILVSSNPATVASDPSLAHRTYLEPLDEPALRAIVRAEKPALVFAAFGGRKALALALALHDDGTLAATGTTLAGISAEALAAALADPAIAAAKRASLGAEAEWTSLEVVAAFDATGAFLPLVTIESLDSAGVHPGDAIAVTPPLHTDAALMAEMHDAARTAILAAGLRAGIATCELAVRRSDRTVHALSVVPGTTRSSALAAQATGYPVTSVSVDLALGRVLSELDVAPPAAHGVVVRWPRFAFETFPDADAALGVHRKSLGESHGVGATLADALRSAARGADDGRGIPRRVRAGSMAPPSKKVLVLGAGPTRIGFGPELAMCASEALIAIREMGFEPVFVDSSVESTAVAARVADHVHLEPVTLERVLAIHERDQTAGVIVQVGGDTALRLAADLTARRIHVFGSPPAALARAVAAVSGARHLDDRRLDEAIAVDVDAVTDGKRVVIAGVMEHLEPAFVHGGDAAAILPAFTLDPEVVARIEDRVRTIALESGLIGLIGVRLAVSGDDIVVLDVEPRAGRTTAFVTRATGFPLVRIATKVMLGETLDALGISERPLPRHVAARERVFPFERLGVDPALGREMRSTGEVIGLDDSPARAYGKALRGIGISLHARGASAAGPSRVLLSVHDGRERADGDRPAAVDLARRFRAIGFDVTALGEVRASLTAARIPFHDAGSDDVDAVVEDIRAGRFAFAVVTAKGDADIVRTRALRAATLAAHIPCFTTIRLARLGCSALEEDPTARVRPLQDWYASDD